jgi:putative intracellular protease/amidase
MNNEQKMSPLVLVLVAAQFDEEFVVSCICRLRSKNIETLLVSLYAGPVIGLRSLWLRPDRHLADLETGNARQARILVLPGPDECAMKLLLNPRVQALIETTIESGGCVAAVSAKTRDLLIRGGLLTRQEGDDGFLFQGDLTAVAFIDQLAARAEFLSEGV